jgi:hypothetical protein
MQGSSDASSASKADPRTERCGIESRVFLIVEPNKSAGFPRETAQQLAAVLYDLVTDRTVH